MKRIRHINTQTFEYISRYLSVNHEAPTIMEIGRHFEMSVGGVYGVLKRLEREGLITRSRKHRGIELADRELMVAGREG